MFTRSMNDFVWWRGAIQVSLPGWLGVGFLLVSLLIHASAFVHLQKSSFPEKEFPPLCILSGKPPLKSEGTRWKHAPDLFKEYQVLVLSMTTRHLFLVEWRGEMVSLPVEMTLTGNETRLLHALWTAYPDACDLYEVMTFMERERQLLWRTATSVRKKLRHFGIDLVICDRGYLLVASGSGGEGRG